MTYGVWCNDKMVYEVLSNDEWGNDEMMYDVWCKDEQGNDVCCNDERGNDVWRNGERMCDVKQELLKRTTDSSFDVALFLLHPKSKGYIRLESSNPLKQPLLDPRFLEDPYDIEMLLKMIRWTQKLEKTSSWKSLRVKLIRYDMEGHCGEIEFNTDAYWRCIIQHFVVSGLHPTSTCRMGSRRDPTAVVDPTLRVYGIKNLRVVDASVMRNVISGNTYSPTLMIAEKAADMIKCGTKY
ncbi:glucose dehydrogenase [FAD, quinone]-like [Mytilus trossulus]|uniref:glucose dehydrogenase [FAD, quinone]-like n=1 Tax=Mytilus trossulus TaxID=6551 RepID=UPI0030045AAB